MTQPNIEPATIQQLQAACPEASADFFVSQLQKGATVEQSVRAHNADLVTEKAALEKQLAGKESSRPKGSKALGDCGSQAASGSAFEEWNERLTEMVSGGLSRSKATCKLAKQAPDLREQVVAEANA